jgi:hypothetical protein
MFCEEKPKLIALLEDGGDQIERENILMAHIAEHLKSIFFLALPL